MKHIFVHSKTHGLKCITVDEEDYDELIKHTWSVSKTGNGSLYASTSINCKKVKMHRMILNVNDKKILIDHKNHDGLNNTKSNIRECTIRQNNINKRSRKNSSSKYLGVSLYKRDNRWRADVRVNGKTIWIGYFDTEELAAKAYDKAALKHHGEFANLNFK